MNGAELAKLYSSGFTSALNLGHSEIDIQNHGHREPILFVLDTQHPRDLIDFWNLRAVRRVVIPVPVQWAQDLSAFCKDFITKNFRPLPGNPYGVKIRVTLMFARSVPTADIDRLHRDYFRVEVDANVIQTWYPPLWRRSPGYTVREMRATLSAGQTTYDLPLSTDGMDVHFSSLYPDFAEEFGNQNRWANVVRLRDWTDQIATAFPCDAKKPVVPQLRRDIRPAVATTEGLVAFCSSTNVPEFWTMYDGTRAITAWLQAHGIKAAVSDAGRATQQIVQTFGGLGGVSSLADPGIVKYLNEISRRPLSRSVQYQEFRNRVQNAIKDDLWKAGSFDALVGRKAVELGLELRCTRCSAWSWYALKDLDYEVTCGQCLRPFQVPIKEPTASGQSRWAYRLIGPFSLPDYARGAYSASLSLRFFSKMLRPHDAGVTWSAGQELDFGADYKVEADYILWYQRRELFGNDHPTDIVFGEAKSFRTRISSSRVVDILKKETAITDSELERVAAALNKDVAEKKDAFELKDIERMRTVANRFPGSVLVFSTMKEMGEISNEEVGLLTEVATWGREYSDENRRTRAPVIILTGTELFGSFSLDASWRKKGGKHAQFAEFIRGRRDSLRLIADLTQQLYLDMPSYSTWLQAKYAQGQARTPYDA